MENEHNSINASTTFVEVIDVLPGPAVIAAPDLTILHINPAFSRLTGFTPEDVKDKPAPYPWWPPARYQEYFQELSLVKEGRKHKTEWLFAAKDGRPFWVRVDVAPVVRNSAVQFLIACWTDITGLKNEEQALRCRLESQSPGGAFRLA